MQRGIGLAAVHVLDSNCVRHLSWLQQRLLQFASQLGLGVFDVYTDFYDCGGSDFRLFDQLVHDAMRGCFDTVFVHWLPCMADDPAWADRIRCLLESDVQVHMVVFA